MPSVKEWLASLGLSEYADRFAEHRIDLSVLRDIKDRDLKEELGVMLLGSPEVVPGDCRTCRPPALAANPRIRSREDEAERRQVTVMFSDLVGSTALSARMDPEDLREVISAYQKCVAETVHRFDGFVARYVGDGVLVYFGYPHAHEDDAERAVRAGLELITAVAGLKSRASCKSGSALQPDWSSLATSSARGRRRSAAWWARRRTLRRACKGSPSRTWSSSAKARADFSAISSSSRTLGRGHQGHRRAGAGLGGAAGEFRGKSLRGAARDRLDRPCRARREFELLLRCWFKATGGEGQVVLLSGEAGIGKSRLTAAFLEFLADERHVRLRYFCSPQHTNSALYPIIGQMERAAGLARDDTLQAKLDKLDACSNSPRHLRKTPRSLPRCYRCRTMDAIPCSSSPRNSAVKERWTHSCCKWKPWPAPARC